MHKKIRKIFKKKIFKMKKIDRGLELWSRAKKIIPGGTMLLSKNPDRYLPNAWPTYFKTAK